MSARFEELAWQDTPIGTVSLRRRRDPALDVDVHEVKLDDEFLMSSLFTVAEVELARHGLAEVSGSDLDVVVGGLGLGHTAATALEDSRVRSLLVVEALDAVIEWHRRDLLPLAADLTADPRTRLVHGDFFELVNSRAGFDPDAVQRSCDSAVQRGCDAILLDIDHSPNNVLDLSHAAFYSLQGLRRLADHLRPGGVFALWSDDPPDDAFTATLGDVFATAESRVVSFANPYGGEAANTLYVAKASSPRG